MVDERKVKSGEFGGLREKKSLNFKLSGSRNAG
jgi:hypothetical protein